MRRALTLFFLLAITSSAFAQSEPDDILSQLSGARVDKTQVYRIRDITIRRDALSISLNRGTIAFLEPVRGRVTGAVFIGSGEVVSIPPDSIEKQQMHRFTGSPILNEAFRTAFFRFRDSTYDEIMREYRSHAIEDLEPGDAGQFDVLENAIAQRSRWLNYRLLPDFLESGNAGFFFGELNGEKLGWLNVTYDPRLVEEVVVVKPRDVSDTVPDEIWASFNRRAETRDPEAAANENKLPLDILSYEIDATISSETRLTARATIRARSVRDGERVLSFDFSRLLRVSAVSELSGAGGAAGASIPVYNYQDVNAFVIVLPKALVAGQEITLQFDYTGDVIEKRGTGISYVGDRGLWYPNLGMQDRAAFNLTFRYPANYRLVATGSRQREWDDAGLRHSIWTSDSEFIVAGFNLGDFMILSDETGPVSIFVSVNNDVETIYKELAAYSAVRPEAAIRAASAATRRAPTLGNLPVNVQPDYSAFNTRPLAESILKETRATTSFFSELFGPYPYSRLTVSQFPVNYSQGWPSLVYLSTVSCFDRAQRERLGIGSESLFLYTELVRAHEIAHQWFGNKVGWKSYRDQWIPEAFANYAGVMYVEHKYGNSSRVREILAGAREALFEKGNDGFTNDSRGPLSIGYRLVSADSPDAYLDTVYNKGTWVVHMLRMLLGEEEFVKMVREFLETFDGKLASTWDLKRIAEKHAKQSLDWFFDQWVFGTGIPKYELRYKVDQASEGFVIEGKIAQQGVPDTFTMPVPVYADETLLGRVDVSGEAGEFRFAVKTRPARVLLDPENTVLSVPD